MYNIANEEAANDEFAEQMEKSNCEHHPFDRELDDFENQICGICGKIMKTAEELWGPDDEGGEDDYIFTDDL